MAAPISLEVMDSAILEETDFGPNMDKWITNTVDIINASFNTITQAFSNLIGVGQTDIGGMGAGPITVTVTGLNSANFVNVTLVSSSNQVTITNVTAITNGFTVTFSGDPGASAVIAYQAFTAKPQ